VTIRAASGVDGHRGRFMGLLLIPLVAMVVAGAMLVAVPDG
jgi:hypothetical protein